MKSVCYYFDVEYAQKYGVEEAIMLQNFIHWILKNKSNEKYCYDGRTWTYSSIKALTQLFPFWTERQIRRIIQSLIDQDVIIIGNYNSTPYDRTIWYAFKEESHFIKEESHFTKWSNGNDQMVKSNLPNSKMDLTEMENGFDQKVKSLNNKELNNKDKDKEKELNNKDIISPDICTQVSNETFMPPSPELPNIIFDAKTMAFKGIEHYIDKWKEVYSLIDIEAEIKKAEAWVIGQPRTKWKKNWKQFLTNWLSRAEGWAEKRSSIKKSNFIAPEDFIRSYTNDK